MSDSQEAIQSSEKRSPAATAGYAPAGKPNGQSSSHLRREVPALARRVLIVGLDGATFDVLNPMMDRGLMPHLKKLIETGVHGILDSTKPPITPAAWTTFMTGKGPGRHGIVDFEKYDARNNKLAFNSTYEIREKTIWEILSEKGLRVGAIHVPMTYPPREVNGFMISGFDTPSIHTEFTWPPELKKDILKKWPDYSYRSNWKRKTFGGNAQFQHNLRHIERSFHQGVELAEYCGEKYGWDVMMVLYKLVDNLQHKAWKYLDPRTAHLYPARAKMSEACFAELDKALGKLFDLARRHEATVMIMSDHGHGSLEGKAQPNALLEKWGYLKIKNQVKQRGRRVQRIMDRLRGKKTKRFDANLGIEHDLELDWSQTKACVMHAGIYGFLYVNLKDRRVGGGGVDAAGDEAVRDGLIRRFSEEMCTTPEGERVRVFPEVHKPETLYKCSREEQPWMPDLLLAPHPGLAVVRRIRGHNAVRWSPPRRMEGTHRVEGIFAAHGPNVPHGKTIHAQIADVAPTLLAALGLRVPQDMEGQVLRQVFDKPLSIEFEPPVATQFTEHDEIYSEKEKEALTKRLSELGYLE